MLLRSAASPGYDRLDYRFLPLSEAVRTARLPDDARDRLDDRGWEAMLEAVHHEPDRRCRPKIVSQPDLGTEILVRVPGKSAYVGRRDR